MAGSGPAGAMLLGMMPYVKMKIDEIDEKTLATLCNVMAQAFEKISNPAISEEEFKEWLKFD